MATEAERGSHVRELESLRIKRSGEEHKPGRLGPLLAAAAAALVVAAGYQLYRRTLGRPLEVESAPVMIRAGGQSGVMLTGSGYVITRAKYITIGTKILGQIVQEPIEEGMHVKKGALLAKIDDRDYMAQLNQAQADYQLELADLKLQRDRARRTGALFDRGYASQDQLDEALNRQAVGQAKVAKAKAAIAYAEFNVGQCTIRSPIDAVVLQKYREVGATINYGGKIEAGSGSTDIVQLADTDDMRVEVDINESDIGKVRIAMPAAIVLDAYPQRTFDARVVKIYPAADRQKGTVKVEVRFDKPDLRVVKPEMSAKVSYLAAASAGRQGALVLVPKKAVVGSGKAAAVWVVREGRAERVPVLTGTEFQEGIEVRQGLEGGESVILSPPDSLRNNQAVTLKAG